jgi:hypothetical protein
MIAQVSSVQKQSLLVVVVSQLCETIISLVSVNFEVL